MRTLSKILTVSTALGASLAAPSALAQQDINPPLPNVLLLVDTSGSMEYMPDGSLPANCTPGATSDENRWTTLVEVLTGTVKNRSCYRQSRFSTPFINEYGIGGEAPYDKNYFLPFHRILSNNCTLGPGTLPANAFDWTSGSLKYHRYDNTGTTCASPELWDQNPDGLLDVFRDRVRFGLMTFDPKSDPGTGLTSPTTHNATTGMRGTWSYFLDWQTSGSGAAGGHPPNCAQQPLEVGARNPAAPPWEGRLISMGRSDATLAQVQTTNDHVQLALMAMRPFGATPLAGLMTDAYTFLRDDASKDPLDTTQYFAPAKDPRFGGGCRQSYIILLSDGEPNLDLRTECEQAGGSCPYGQPYEIAKALAAPADPKLTVKTFTVGFGLSSPGGVDCNTLQMPLDYQPGGKCVGAQGSLKACCTLARVAYEGGTSKAYFADDIASLRSVLSNVLGAIAVGSTSRTLPAFGSGTASSGGGNAPAKSYEFVSSFAPMHGELWAGNLERKRYACETNNGQLEAVPKTVDPTKGDDFAANVNQGKAARARKFLTFVGTETVVNGTPTVRSRGTIRPSVSSDEGLGVYGGTEVSGDYAAVASALKSTPLAMELVPMPAMCSAANLGAASAGDCAERLARWELGGNNGGGLPTRSGNEFGAIYHATPTIKGAPNEFLRDESYALFAEQQAKQPLMLYTATTDGQMHAFKVASNDPQDQSVLGDKLENNELWSFLPPYVLPGIASQYPATQQILLDGPATVKDVVFQRTLGQAKAGTAGWRRVLVAGGRGGGPFYYALDVTDPDKPTFLWQISKTPDGAPLFGPQTGKPGIATIALKEGSAVNEVAVAVLPGGTATVVGGACSNNRQSTLSAHIDASYKPRTKVRCWVHGPGRSLSVVRLDNGQLIANFRGELDDGPTTLSGSVVKVVPFDSPITGDPIPYPATAGVVSDRIYVGDADGTMWRVNLASPDPTKWDVHLMFDAYSLTGDAYNSGQPIATPPVVTVDGLGNTVMLFSTGDQEMFTASSTVMTRAWSITEKPTAVGSVPFNVKANWVLPFTDGKLVTGPIALFDGAAYFSTFTPTSGDVCSDGFGAVWGVDYLEATPSATGPKPVGRLPLDPNAVPIQYVDHIDESTGVIVFGVGVAQVPSCLDPVPVNDSLAGPHFNLGAVSPVKYELRYQTGAGAGQQPGQQKTHESTRALTSPRGLSHVDSWASIVE
ncbi:MAG: hypothetical protein IT373_38265 [Polyangiaceae bacterium]|nr:hypothetical protein [Polyangiaceae bacterium]